MNGHFYGNGTGLWQNSVLSDPAKNLLGALTNRRIASAYDAPSREELVQEYAQQVIRATLQQTTDAILRITPVKEVDSARVTFSEIKFDTQWWGVLAAETTPNVGFLEKDERQQSLIHRGAAVRVYTKSLSLPQGRAEFRELLHQQANGMLQTMAVLTIRTLADQGTMNMVATLEDGGTAMSRVATLKTVVGAGSAPDRIGAAVGNLVGNVKNTSTLKPVVLIDPKDAGALNEMAIGLQPNAGDELPRAPGVMTNATGPLLATAYANIFGVPHSTRRSVEKNGAVVRQNESLLNTTVTVMEYATFPSESVGSMPGNTQRVIEIADHKNGGGWRAIGFDDALTAGQIGNENIVAGSYAGDVGPNRNLPWNACTSRGHVEKASVLGQLDEAVMPTNRFAALATAMAARRSLGGSADFNRHASDLQILLGMMSSAPVTADFVSRIESEFASRPLAVESNQIETTTSAGWVPSSHYGAVSRIPASRSPTDSSDVPPGLLSATGLSALIVDLRGWATESTVQMATRAMAFLASLEASLNPMMGNNLFLGPAAVPQNLPKDTSIQGGKVFHLLGQPAVPVFAKSATATGSVNPKITFSEKQFSGGLALPTGTLTNTELAAFDSDRYGQSQFAMRGGNVILKNDDSGAEMVLPAHIAYAYLYNLPTLAVARRLPRTALVAYQKIAGAVKAGAFRRFAELVPSDAMEAVHLINHVTNDLAASATEIDARVSAIIKNPTSVSEIVEKKAASSSIPKVIKTASPTAGITFGTGLDTDFALWRNVSNENIYYLNPGSRAATLRAVSEFISQELSSPNARRNMLDSGFKRLENESLKGFLEDNSAAPEPARFAEAAPPAVYVRTDLMFSPTQAQQLYELAQAGNDFLLPGDPDTGYTQPLRPVPGGYFSISAARTSSAATNVQMLADTRLKAAKAPVAGSGFVPVRPKFDTAPRAMLSMAQPLSAEKMAGIMAHPNMTARLLAVDGYSPSERLSALLILGTRCDSTDSLLSAHRNGIPLPFGLAVFRAITSSMRSIIAVAPGELTAYNALFNPRTTAGMDATIDVTFVNSSMHHGVVVQGKGVMTAPGFMFNSVISGGSVDFVTQNNPGVGSLHVAVVPLGWTPRGDINLIDGTSGIPAARELHQRIMTNEAFASQGIQNAMLKDLQYIAVQADYREPSITPMGTMVMLKKPGTQFAHLTVRAD